MKGQTDWKTGTLKGMYLDGSSDRWKDIQNYKQIDEQINGNGDREKNRKILGSIDR